jgi:hypothetical protein
MLGAVVIGMMPDKMVAHSFRPLCADETEMRAHMRTEWKASDESLRAGGSGAAPTPRAGGSRVVKGLRALLGRKQDVAVPVKG